MALIERFARGVSFQRSLDDDVDVFRMAQMANDIGEDPGMASDRPGQSS